MRRCSPSSPTANRGRARPWRLRLEPARATVQRALDSLAAAGKVQSFRRGRARLTQHKNCVGGLISVQVADAEIAVVITRANESDRVGFSRKEKKRSEMAQAPSRAMPELRPTHPKWC